LDKGEDLLRLDSKVERLYIEKKNNILSKISQVFKLKKLVKSIKPDGIVVFGNIKVALLALFKSNTPILWSERGDFASYKFLHRKLILKAYKNADLLVFQTEMARDQYPRSLSKKSFVIPNPCFLASKRSIKEKCPERKKRVVSVGRFAFEKRFDVLINSFIKIHPLFPEYELLLFGDGELKDEYESIITKSHAEDFIHLPGKIKNIEDYIYDSSLFVLSSEHEGIPNATPGSVENWHLRIFAYKTKQWFVQVLGSW